MVTVSVTLCYALIFFLVDFFAVFLSVSCTSKIPSVLVNVQGPLQALATASLLS